MPDIDSTLQQPLPVVGGDDALLVVIGILTLAAGLASIALSVLRRKTADATLIAFGCFSALYGLRLLAGTRAVPLLFDLPARHWDYARFIITYVIPLPFILFWKPFSPDRWRPYFKWLAYGQITFAITATTLAFLTGEPGVAGLANNLLVVSFLGALLITVARNLMRAPETPYMRVLGAGLILFLATAFYANLAGSTDSAHPAVEPLGFLLLACCLGYVVARRIFDRERRLVSIEAELETARQIQTSILPERPPEVRGLTISARYLPMNAVAGDYYDFLSADRNNLGVLIADVSGHGIPAALIASMVKVAFSSQAENAGEPARIMRSLNRILCRQLRGQFVTAAYLFIETDSGIGWYSGAGHPPMLLCRDEDQSVCEIEQNGPVLGVIPAAEYSTRRVSLRPGDRLLFYTDGILEATDGSERYFGDHRFREVIRSNLPLDPEAFASAVLDSVRSWTGTGAALDQQDDITLIVLDLDKPLQPDHRKTP